MMRFKEFLMREDGVGVKHLPAAKMTFEQMVEWVENNASHFVSTGNLIFRGIASENAEGLYNGAQLNRKAANTYNYGNLWISNHNDWAKYPPRTKSFICTTDKDYTDGYGTPYLVIPSDDSNIGICPDEDLWDSFPEVMEITDLGLSGFMDFIDYLVNFKSKGQGKAIQQDWDHFAGVLNSIDIEDIKNTAEDEDAGSYILPAYRLLKYMQKNQLETLYEVFDRVFNPKKAGFDMEKAGHFSGPQEREVWMSGSVLMLTPATWMKIKEQING